MISISQSYRLAKYFPDEAGHLPVPANLLLSEMDIPFFTWLVCFLTFSLSFHTLESYHQASDCTENDNSQMFCQEVSSVLLSDRSGNDMLCSILFPSLGFNVLTDYFYWSASSCQQAKALTPKASFQSFSLISGYSFFNSLLLALL